MFLKNYWYVAAWSDEVAHAPFSRRILDIPVLMYRTQDGRAVAIDDRCPHRRAPLSLGRLVGDDVQCAYHGMRFGPDGTCTHVPGQDHIQNAAHARAFPLVDRYGFLWIWTGDPAAADLDAIPAQYAIQTDRAWAGDGVMIHTRSSAMLITENVLDLTHASYLHARTVGTDYVPYLLPDTLIEDDHVAVSRGFKNVKNPSTFIKIMGFEMADREQVIHFWPPGYCLLEMNVRPAGVREPSEERRMVVLSPITPETEKSHHQFLCFYRNFELDDEKLTKVMMDEVYRTALEDTEMLEAQQQNMDADPPDMDIVNLRVDQGPIAARRMIEKLLVRQQVSFLKSLPTDAKIFDVFASRPEVYEPFVEMVERVTRGDSPLSAGERELIGAFVASLNTCTLCVDIHSEAAKAHGVDLDEPDPKLVPVLDLVRKLTESPHKVVAKDIEAVYEAGWNEAALHDVVLVTCIASFMNRFVFGLGIAATDHAHAQARARARADYTGAAGNAIATDGYASRFRKLLEEKDAEE